METLNELVRGHSLPRTAQDGDDGKLVSSLWLMLNARPYPCEKKAVDDAIETLAQDYFRNRMEKRYARLSEDLFGLTREVALQPEHVQKSQDIKSITAVEPATIPLLACTTYGAAAWAHEGMTTAEVTYRSNGVGNNHDVKFHVQVDAPPLTALVKDAAAEAMAHAYDVCAAALRIPALRDYMARHTREHEAPENIFADWMVPVLKVLWKPTEESMKVTVDARNIRDPDPALLLSFNQDKYLVTTWDVAHEEPFRHYLAEYTQPKQEKLKLHRGVST